MAAKDRQRDGIEHLHPQCPGPWWLRGARALGRRTLYCEGCEVTIEAPTRDQIRAARRENELAALYRRIEDGRVSIVPERRVR